ncbi:MAG: hypothetical protein LBP79_06055 [Clostridiales bacterium]|jgi:hypothetical protein|nr:hypothetical protein [Clostridiales bacterium]
MRSEAQKAADKRYSAKKIEREKTLVFRTRKEEAEEISSIIDNSGLSKIGFLRAAIAAYQRGEWKP